MNGFVWCLLMLENDMRNYQKSTFIESELLSVISNIPGGVLRYSYEDEFEIDFVNNNMLEILGCSRAQFFDKYKNNIELLFEKGHLLKYKQLLMNLYKDKKSSELEHEILTYNGATKWVISKHQLIENGKGKNWVYVIFFDIQKMKTIQSQIERDKERNEIILSLNSDAFFEYNIAKDTILFTKANEFNITSGKEIPNCIEEIRRSGLLCKTDVQKIVSFLQSGKNQTIEFRLVRNSSAYLWCKAQSIIINDENGNPNILIGSIRDIDSKKREKEKQLQAAKLDPLTGLYNKSYINQKIESYIKNIGSNSKNIMMIININNFMYVNESLGRLFGDAVLSNIADNLRQIFEKTDIVGRIGGDKFLVFMKNTDNIELLEKKTEEIANIFQDTYTGERQDCKISCSIGASRYPEDGLSFEELFKNADLALFEGIQQGRKALQVYDKKVHSFLLKNNSEFYNLYQIEEDEIESRYFDKEITNFAFNIMSKAKEISSAINILLAKVGKHFSANSVSILEASKDKTSLNTTYMWSDKHGLFINSKYQYPACTFFSPENYDENGVFYISDVNRLEDDSELKERFANSKVTALLQCAFYEEGVYQGCLCITDKKNPRFWTKYEMDTLVTITKIVSSYLLKVRISESVQEKLEEILNYDKLTGLSTLYKLKLDILQLLENNPNESFVIIYTDFSNFKYINDTFGFEVGDQILCDYADELNNSINSLGAARVSSDKFVSIRKGKDFDEVQKSVIDFNQQFSLEQKKKNLLCNIVLISGGCLLQNKDDITSAVDNANIARKTGKGSSKTVFKFYNQSMETQIRRELEIINCMEDALKNGEFQVYLQPKISLDSNRLVGAEALIRWNKGNEKMLMPDEFIPVFEKNGFILNIDFFVYEEVCKLIRIWLDSDLPEIPISVNVSRVHLNDLKFVEKVKSLVQKYNIPPHLLELELTESIFLDKTQLALSTMKELRDFGFDVSIDDFGAGYSSLNLLKDMTSDVLKLDKGFFRSGDMKKEEQIIVSSIISMAKQLNMKVLSEGVETKMQSDFLKENQCDMAQGYLFAKPMPIQDFEDLMCRDQEFLT